MPAHVLINSIDLKGFTASQWLEEKHSSKWHLTWRKLHLAVDADSGMVVAQVLTDQQSDDASKLGD
ncbi:MAG: hypothetical protein ACI9ZF_003768 [Bradyrhizobium sp.]